MELSAFILSAPGRCWRPLVRLAVVGALFLLPASLLAEDIFIVQSRPTGAHAAVSELVKQQLSSSLPLENNVTVVSPSQLDLIKKTTSGKDYIVTVGTNAFAAVLASNPTANVVATLIPEQTYNVLKNKSNRNDNRVSALFIEQSFHRNLDLARIVLPNRRTGVLLGSGSSRLYGSLSEARQKQGMDIYLKKLKPGENLVSALDQVLKNSSVLIAFADPEVSNRNTAQHILLTTYRQRIPVVAYSRAYVKAGALMAVYSTPEQYARQTAEIVLQNISGNSNGLLPPQYPRYFSVEINQSVAHSLGINLKPVQQIESQLRSLAVAPNE